MGGGPTWNQTSTAVRGRATGCGDRYRRLAADAALSEDQRRQLTLPGVLPVRHTAYSTTGWDLDGEDVLLVQGSVVPITNRTSLKQTGA